MFTTASTLFLFSAALAFPGFPLEATGQECNYSSCQSLRATFFADGTVTSQVRDLYYGYWHGPRGGLWTYDPATGEGGWTVGTDPANLDWRPIENTPAPTCRNGNRYFTYSLPIYWYGSWSLCSV